MAIDFPHNVTFADAEEIVCDFVDKELEGVTPEIHAYTFLPGDSTSDLDDGVPFVLVQRVGGTANYDARAAVDHALIELRVIAATRQDSWAVISYIRQRFYDLASGGFVGERRITSIDESNGPSEIMYADSKQRAVRYLFRIGIRRAVR